MIAIDPLRREIVQEMHLRPSPAVAAPARIVQILSLQTPETLHGAVDHAARLGIIEASTHEPRDGVVERDGATVLWERHTEATTLTAIIDDGVTQDTRQRVLNEISAAPGRVLRAVKIDLENDEDQADRLRRLCGLASPETVSGRIGKIQFWSNFTLDEADGFGRLVLYSNGANTNDLGRVIQQLQELGNYRNLALLGLPLVRRLAGALSALEERIGKLIADLSANKDDREVLALLVDAAVEAARLRDETAFRLGATAAYGRIVSDRLETLAPAAVSGFQTLADFNNRRLLPALRTCANFTDRLDQLADHIAYTSDLLRTRIETAVHWQNGELLRSLGETGRAQLRLQHLVEGLSVFAVGYYAVSLLGYGLEALPKSWGIDGHALSGYLVVPVLVSIALYLRAQRSRSEGAMGVDAQPRMHTKMDR